MFEICDSRKKIQEMVQGQRNKWGATLYTTSNSSGGTQHGRTSCCDIKNSIYKAQRWDTNIYGCSTCKAVGLELNVL